jgi:hypothetical protein
MIHLAVVTDAAKRTPRASLSERGRIGAKNLEHFMIG